MKTQLKITWDFFIWILGMSMIITMAMPALTESYNIFYRVFIVSVFVGHNIFTMFMIKIKEIEL